MKADTRDELGQMGAALNRMLEGFERSLGQVRDSVEHTTASAAGLAAGSEALSSGGKA